MARAGECLPVGCLPEAAGSGGVFPLSCGSWERVQGLKRT